MTRKAMIAGNWKMNTNVAEGCQLAKDLLAACTNFDDREVVLAPPFTIMPAVAQVVAGSEIQLASQNVCWETSGAFTGEIAPAMVKEAGGAHAILGHSERRQIFGESDELINKRVLGALSHGLKVIFCIGETIEEREANITFEVLEGQIRKGLAGVSADAMQDLVIAYEPVWAIGTGVTASKEQAQEVHQFIRELILKMYEKTVADQLRILYGGSVKETNVDELMSQPDIDGALVGGAALSAASFGQIVNFE